MADPISAAVAAALIKGAAKLGGALLGRKRQRIPAAELRRRADVARRFENQERAKRGQPLLPWYPWQVQAQAPGSPTVPTPPSPGGFPPDTPPRAPPDEPDEPLPGDPEEPFPEDVRQPEAGYPDSAFEDLPPLPGESVAVAGIAGSAAAKDKLLGAARKYYGRILQQDRGARGRGRARRGPRLPRVPSGPVGIATVGAILIGEALDYRKKIFADLDKEQEKILKDADKAANRAADAIRKQNQEQLRKAEREQDRADLERYRNAKLAQTDRAFRAARTDKALDQARQRASRATSRVNATSRALDKENARRARELAKARKATTPKTIPRTRPGTFANPQILAALAGALGQYISRERGGRTNFTSSTNLIQDGTRVRIGDPVPTVRAPGLTSSITPGLGFAPGLSFAPQAAKQAAEKCYTVCRKPGKRRKKKAGSKRVCYDRKI